MGFLSKDDLLSFEREENNRKMQEWATKYPWAAAIMLGNHSNETLLEIWNSYK